MKLTKKLRNIGARRLYTIVEKVLEEISYEAPHLENGKLELIKIMLI